MINGDVYLFNEKDAEKILSKKELKNIRSSAKVTSSKKKVKSRDGYCMCCGETEKQIQVHHILPVAEYPDLASDENNMICLCQACHTKYHQMYEGKEVNAVTFAKYMKDFGRRIYG